MSGADTDDEVAALVALSALPALGPGRLLALHGAGDLVGAWAAMRAGDGHLLPALRDRLGTRPEAVSGRWAAAASLVDPAELLDRHRGAGVAVCVQGTPAYPLRLAADPEPPAVLYHRGDPDALDRPTVAIVGTRNATRIGREVAHEMGEGLAAIGVGVVSGLALGIDGAAHRGALAVRAGGATGTDDAPRSPGSPVGVVAAGLDIAYPRRHADLHRAVIDAGLLLSEVPLGLRPDAWRFPARNRIIAGLADVVVVVESRESGGSIHTAEAALQRGVTVLATPGNVRDPASAGTNDLLAAGAHVGRDLEDILIALGLGGSARPGRRRQRPVPADPADRALLDALGRGPTTVAELVERLGQPVDRLAPSLVRLEVDGWIERHDGWLQRVEDRRV